MVDSIINCENPADADAVIIGITFDGTSSFGKGSDRGPAAIRACLHRQIEFFDRYSNLSPALSHKIAWADCPDTTGAKAEEMLRVGCAEYSKHAHAFRLLIGGEHSVSNIAWSEFANRASEITVVQIDAHADFREDDSDYNPEPHGKLAHCSVMKRAYDAGFNILQVGIRAYSEEERALFGDKRVRVFEWGRKIPEIEDVLAAVKTEQVYLTIDVDGIDPAFMPATGTPVQGGLDWYYAIDLVLGLARTKTIIAADIVEVAPRSDDRRTEYGAAQLAYTLLGGVFGKKG